MFRSILSVRRDIAAAASRTVHLNLYSLLIKALVMEFCPKVEVNWAQKEFDFRLRRRRLRRRGAAPVRSLRDAPRLLCLLCNWVFTAC